MKSDTVFHCSLEKAYDLLAEPRKEALFRPEIERTEVLSAGPLAVGTVIRGWVRIPGESARLGIYLVADEVVTEYDPPRAYATRITDQPVLTRLTFDPVANGTHVTAICDDTLGFEQALTGGVFLRGQLERRILKSRQEGCERARALLEEPAA